MKKRTKDYWAEIASVAPADLVFVDEAGSHVAMTPLRARAPKGQRAVGSVPRCRGTVTTMLGAIALSGITAIATIEGATTGGVFTAFVEQFLAPTLRPGNVVVLDNLGAHKVSAARAAIEATGARLIFQPQYSPEVNPIEEGWSKLKHIVRKIEPRTIAELDAAIVQAVDRITPQDAAGWFRHAGYQVK